MVRRLATAQGLWVRSPLTPSAAARIARPRPVVPRWHAAPRCCIRAASSSSSSSSRQAAQQSSSALPAAVTPPPAPSTGHSAHHGAFDSPTHRCGDLSQQSTGQRVVLAGWLDSLRIVSKHLGFVALRDHSGTVQFVLQANGDPRLEDLITSVSSLPLQSIVLVKGQVQLRPEADRNPSLPTGVIEIHLSSLQLLNPARRDLPFLPTDSEHADRASSDLRAKYRYLDLRRKTLGDNIRLRSRVAQSIRNHLYEHDFLEIETPILLRSTPEGAREFLVPTRVSSAAASDGDGHEQQQQHVEPMFYALPQSPQQPKQLLIASGVTDRYFQIAKCFRDEDGRKDRQPEFTQIDLEMGFVSGGPPPSSAAPTASSQSLETASEGHDARDAQGRWRIGGWQVRDVMEGLVARIWSAAGRSGLDYLDPDSAAAERRGFPVLSYWTAMTTYGSDKPDLRYHLGISNISSGFRHHNAVMAKHADGAVDVALEILPHHHTSAGKLSNKELEALLSPFKGRVERFRVLSWQNSNELAALLLKKSQSVRGFLSHHEELEASRVDVDRLSVRLASVLAASRAAEGSVEEEDGNVCGVDVFVSVRSSPPEGGSTSLGDLRKSLAATLSAKGLLSISAEPHFAWITEFPLFTLADDDKNQLSCLSSGDTISGGDAAAMRWQSSHHPFTAPMAEDARILGRTVDRTQVGRVRGQHYDLVLDGQEIGGGSVRIHDAEMQRRVFEEVLELTPSETARFSHLLHALSCGAPPHAGIALGFDRLMSILCDTTSIRDVIPFPKMGSGVDPVFGSPSSIDDLPTSETSAVVAANDKGVAGTEKMSDKLLKAYGLRRL